jgi:hypothetical protein
LAAKNTEEDAANIEGLRRRGVKTGEAVELVHYFALGAHPGSEPSGAVDELKTWRLSVSADEEVSGDGHWHVSARGYWELPDEGLAPWRQLMEALAARHGLIYNGWNEIQGTTGVERSTPPPLLPPRLVRRIRSTLIKNHADAFGCLAIAFIGASFLAFFLLGLGQMGDMQDERLRPPLWQSAAIAMTLTFGGALVLATYAVGRAYRLPVFIAGFLIAVALYVVIGMLWWFRV